MNCKKLVILLVPFFFCIILKAQDNDNDLELKLKADIGLIRSELVPTLVKTEEINGGVGWNGNFLSEIQINRFFLETGIGYRNLNFLISENLSQTQKYAAKATSFSIPFLLGTNVIGRSYHIAPLLKVGIRFDKTLGLNNQREDILTKSDLQNWNITYELNIGVKLYQIELLFTYNIDSRNFITPIADKHRYIGIKLAHGIKI